MAGLSFFEVVHSQRAIRHFTSEPVTTAVIQRILDAAICAPNGRNAQRWRWVVVSDRAQTELIAAAVREEAFPDAKRAELLRESAQTEDVGRRWLIESSVHLFADMARPPVLVVPCLYKNVSPVPDQLSLFAGASIYPAIQNLMLAARALGVGSVLTTLNLYIDQRLREILNLPEEAQPAAIIPLGYPRNSGFTAPKRRPAGEVTFWDRWDHTDPPATQRPNRLAG